MIKIKLKVKDLGSLLYFDYLSATYEVRIIKWNDNFFYHHFHRNGFIMTVYSSKFVKYEMDYRLQKQRLRFSDLMALDKEKL